MIGREMKQEVDLTADDLLRHPVWIGVHNFDIDQPWCEQADETTVRPWTGDLPFNEDRGMAIISAEFRLADGSAYSGYCHVISKNWDTPEIPIGRIEGRKGAALSWSEMHGGETLSKILLQTPVIFVGDRSFDFQLRTEVLRKDQVREFFTSIGKRPNDVFPIEFSGRPGLASAISSGEIDGFYSFPLWSEHYEIVNGESILEEPANVPSRTKIETRPDNKNNDPGSSVDSLGIAILTSDANGSRDELTLKDLKKSPVWVRVEASDPSKPFPPRHRFVPWTGSLPVDSEDYFVFVVASFHLRDGTLLEGFARAVPENWVNIVPAPMRVGPDRVIQGAPPAKRFGGSPLAIIGEHLPTVFIEEKKFCFWCGPKVDLEELRRLFYALLSKDPTRVFPITFRCAPGYATGIIEGVIHGFYEPQFVSGKAPRITP
jgi:hypothetical protein